MQTHSTFSIYTRNAVVRKQEVSMKERTVWTPEKIEELRHLYWDECLSPFQIKEKLNLKQKTCVIVYTLKKYGYPTRTLSESLKLVHKSSEFRKLKQAGLRKRTKKLTWSPEFIEKVRHMYWDLQIGTRDIAKELEATSFKIANGMKRHNIPLRSISEAQKIAHKIHMDSYIHCHSSTWKGGRKTSPHGYILVCLHPNDPYYPMIQKGHYVPEHRYIMAQHLGRCLTKYEYVHHINGNRADNRIENLKLLSRYDHEIYTKLCSNCPLRKEIRLLRWQIKELKSSLDGSLKLF